MLAAMDVSMDEVMSMLSTAMARVVQLSQLAIAHPTVQHWAVVLAFGGGIGLLLMALSAVFPAKTPGVDYEKVLERGVFTETEFKALQAKQAKEHEEAYQQIRRAMLGAKACEEEDLATAAAAAASKCRIDGTIDGGDNKPGDGVSGGDADADASDGDGASDGAGASDGTGAGAGATQGLRRRKRGKGGKVEDNNSGGDDDTGEPLIAALHSDTTDVDDNDGASTDEEDMNPELNKEQLKMQKTLMGTRNVKKLSKILAEASRKAKRGENPVPLHRTVARRLDLFVYLVLFGLLLWSLQSQYGMDVITWIGYLFPKEAAVIRGRVIEDGAQTANVANAGVGAI